MSQSLRLKGNELTLDDAITTARQYEQVKSRLSTKRTTDVDELTSQFLTMSRKETLVTKEARNTTVTLQMSTNVTGRVEVVHNPVVDAVDLTNLRKFVRLATENAENVTRSDISRVCVEQRV